MAARSEARIARLRALRELPRYYILGSLVEPIIIGVLVGLAAAIFGYAFSSSDRLGAWVRSVLGPYWVFYSLALFVVTGLALVAVFRKYEGSSTNKFLEYFHFHGGYIPTIPAILFIVGSLTTVAAGGSVGPEGPALILGGYLGYLIARKVFSHSAYEAKEYALVGAGAAVAAVFKAPFTAMTFVLEVLYKRDLETSVFLETVVATITAYFVCVALTGPGGIFAKGLGGPLIPTPQDILAGVVAGLAATLVARIMVEAKHVFAELSEQIVKVSSVAGPLLLTTLIWLAATRHPFVLGGGEHLAEKAIHGELHIPYFESLWASVEKSVLTAASLTFGGTGGIFLPLVAIGGLLGYGLHGILRNVDVTTLVLASTAGLFAGTNSVVLSAVLFGVEVLGGHAFIPSAIAAAIAYILSMGSSLHSNQLPRREVAKKLALAELLHRLAEMPGALKKLRTIPAIEAANRNPVKLHADMEAGYALHVAAQQGHVAYPVVEEGDRLIGYVQLEDLVAVDPTVKLRHLVREAPTIPPDMSVLHAAAIMISRDLDRLFIIDEEERLLGMLTKTDLLRTLMHIYEEEVEREKEESFE